MIKKIDHIVITTRNINACLDFYTKLGFEVKAQNNRYELFAGDFKINVHILGKELSPHAQNVQSGSADICFEISGDIDAYMQELQSKGFIVELGVVSRNGVRGEMKSCYLRDPDGNLLEFASYQ